MYFQLSSISEHHGGSYALPSPPVLISNDGHFPGQAGRPPGFSDFPSGHPANDGRDTHLGPNVYTPTPGFDDFAHLNLLNPNLGHPGNRQPAKSFYEEMPHNPNIHDLHYPGPTPFQPHDRRLPMGSHTTPGHTPRTGSKRGGYRPGRKTNVERTPQYYLRRERNNIAVRKSMEKTKRNYEDLLSLEKRLSVDNQRLETKVAKMTTTVSKLRGFYMQLKENGMV